MSLVNFKINRNKHQISGSGNKQLDTKRVKKQHSSMNSWFSRYSDNDTKRYRDGYPGKKEHPKWSDNLRFYKNEIKSEPNGDLIDDIHTGWSGDIKKLEQHHGYIQWIFPIREEGMNWNAQELQLHEAEAIKNDEGASRRVLLSYKMMLDFYGMRLKDVETGEITRAENWESRFKHLNRSFHNYLRITRILKSLGELGYEKLKAPWVQFMLREALEEKTLPNLLDSCEKYWIGVIKDDEKRKQLYAYLDEGRNKNKGKENKKNTTTATDAGTETGSDEVLNVDVLEEQENSEEKSAKKAKKDEPVPNMINKDGNWNPEKKSKSKMDSIDIPVEEKTDLKESRIMNTDESEIEIEKMSEEEGKSKGNTSVSVAEDNSAEENQDVKESIIMNADENESEIEKMLEEEGKSKEDTASVKSFKENSQIDSSQCVKTEKTDDLVPKVTNMEVD